MRTYFLAFPDQKSGQMVRAIGCGGFRYKRAALSLLADRQANGEAFKDERVLREPRTKTH